MKATTHTQKPPANVPDRTIQQITPAGASDCDFCYLGFIFVAFRPDGFLLASCLSRFPALSVSLSHSVSLYLSLPLCSVLILLRGRMDLSLTVGVRDAFPSDITQQSERLLVAASLTFNLFASSAIRADWAEQGVRCWV